jgi:hypothetical protein
MPAKKKQDEEQVEEQDEEQVEEQDEEQVEEEAEDTEGIFDVSITNDEITVTVSRDDEASDNFQRVAKLVDGL